MEFTDILIANRGEIVVRIARAAADLGLRSHAVFSDDDAESDHVYKTDRAHALGVSGPPAYLDGDRIVSIAREAGCTAIHPGYGFLSESAAFARLCDAAGIAFIGPGAEVLDLFGDKTRARALAQQTEVPVLAGSPGAVSLDQAIEFLNEQPHGTGVMLKAVAGGGGRGQRPVRTEDELVAAYQRCCSEALQAFGNGAVYVESLFERARHIEVQVAGDGTDVTHLWERECSLQRSRQKIVEIAPAPGLAETLRDRLIDAALRMARAVRLRNLATFEFLVEDSLAAGARFVFLEANPRLQVEHTVTEEITGIDLVRTQIELASGRGLEDLGLAPWRIPVARGCAMQLRLNAEVPGADGTLRPTSGVLTAFDPPSGPGVRVDTCAHAGHRVNPRFDSLLAKIVVHAPGGLEAAVSRARRALAELRVEGVGTNRDMLLQLLAHPDFLAGRWHTGLVEAHMAALCAPVTHARLHREVAAERPAAAPVVGDPLAILAHGRRPVGSDGKGDASAVHGGGIAVFAPVLGTVLGVEIRPGQRIERGAPICVLEAMKMEHVVPAPVSGVIGDVRIAPHDMVQEGALVTVIEPSAGDLAEDAGAGAEVAQAERADLGELQRRRALTLDDARPAALERRHATGMRTARENIADLVDPDSFREYGAFVVAAQRSRRSLADLIERTPADGLVMGIGRVNGALFPDRDARCAVMAYDYTVLAGTQGSKNHEKKDRLFELAARWRLPLVAFAEGGGGRPGDTDVLTSGMLHIKAFSLLPQLSGLVPMVGVVAGRCFAGNAVVAGCCDVIVATRASSLGMGGPAMIEGGGLGTFHPDEVGPSDVQRRNGVIDVLVEDEASAVAVVRRYLSYFQGPLRDWTCADQSALRHVVPENRRRAYDAHAAVDLIADSGSVLELRADFATNMITALIRIEGRPLGLLANNPMVLGGAIDAAAADKAARFLQLCDAFDLPVLSLCDTPGNMVGPEAERTALVRHCCRLYVIGSNLTVPIFSVVMRKAYGLGAQGMVGGSFHLPLFSVAWPTGEFGPMNLEGAVKLGFRRELEAIPDPLQRKARFDEMVARAYADGEALSAASLFEIDDVIDPAETRTWVSAGLRSLPPVPVRSGKKRPCIDTW